MYTANHTFTSNLFSHEQSTSREENSVQGWLSVDPLAKEYPGLSPYIYVSNNPVALYDPDGRKIRSSENTSDKKLLIYSLLLISATNQGERMVDNLIANPVRTVRIDAILWTGNSDYNPSTGEVEVPVSVWRSNRDGSEMTPANVLAHELFHAYDDFNGGLGTRKEAENGAVRFANYFRAVYGQELRDQYWGLGLRFPDDPNLYAPNEAVGYDQQMNEFEAEDGSVYIGMGYSKSDENGSRFEFQIGKMDKSGNYTYEKFSSCEEYQQRWNEITEEN